MPTGKEKQVDKFREAALKRIAVTPPKSEKSQKDDRK